MTEERIKELAEDWSNRSVSVDTYRTELEDFIRTVAAEAREEGLEEGYRAGFTDAEAEPDRHLENSLYEWLKEKGK